MATLTWRNVDAPSFSGALEGYRTAAQLLGNATRAGTDAIDTFTKANTDAADRAIMQRSMGIQDASQLQQALANGSIVGNDGGNASVETLRNIDNRVSTLLNRDVVRQGYDQTAYTNKRVQDRNVALDAARDPMADLEVASRNGDARTVNTILQTNPQMRGLYADQFSAAVDRANSLGVGYQARRGTEEAFGMTSRNNDRTVRDQTDEDTALRAALEVQRNSVDMEGAQREYSRLSRNMSPGAASRLQNAVRGMGYNINAPISSGSTAGGTAAAASAGTAGDYSSFLVKLESGGNANAKSGSSSATGLHQFTDSTWLGTVDKAKPSWAQGMSRDEILAQRTNPERSTQMEGILRAGNTQSLTKAGQPLSNSNLYAMHHFGESGGLKFAQAPGDTPISSILSADQIAANPYLQGQTKSQVEGIWAARADAATSPAEVLASKVRDRNIQADLARADEQANSGVLNRRLAAISGKERPLPELTAELKSGPYKGYSDGELGNEIRAIAAAGGISNAQAAMIMSENFVPRSKAMSAINYIPFIELPLAENTFDRNMNIETARAYKGGTLTTQSENAQRQVLGEQFQKMDQRVTDLNQEIKQVRIRAESTGSPQIEEQLSRLLIKRADAKTMLEDLRKMQQNTQQLTSADLAVQRAQAAERQRGVNAPTAKENVTEAARRRRIELDEQMNGSQGW